MRILVVGAGAIGGYFGGRLKAAGRDVTFLVRARRAAQLAKTGLVIRSPAGNIELPSPPTIAAENLREPYDLILLSCKAYDLASAIDSFAPAVGPEYRDPAAAQRHGAYGRARRAFRRGRRARRPMPDLDDARCRGPGSSSRPMHFLSFGEQDGAKSDARASDPCGAVRRRLRRQSEHGNHAGNVGESGPSSPPAPASPA